MNAMLDTLTLKLPLWPGGETLRCVGRREETHDCATFELMADHPAHFAYHPGQFVTVGVDIDGKKHQRAYSISSTPSRPEALSITVKRVPCGLVSNHLLDHFQPGDRIEASAPMGEFRLDTDAPPREVVLLSAGSGITPMMAMSRWLLDHGHAAAIRFIHSAHSEHDVIFRDELVALQQRHANFRLDLFLSQPSERIACHSGRLNAEQLDALLPDVGDAHIFLCGQQGYMEMVEAWRCKRGIADERFRKESFTPATAAPVAQNAATFGLSVPGFGKSGEIRAGQSLLEALEHEAVPIFGACRSGVCGSCKCKVTEGETESTSTATLTDDEIAAGYVLACSTHAKSDLVVDLAI